jgi:hypothetical protein
VRGYVRSVNSASPFSPLPRPSVPLLMPVKVSMFSMALRYLCGKTEPLYDSPPTHSNQQDRRLRPNRLYDHAIYRRHQNDVDYRTRFTQKTKHSASSKSQRATFPGGKKWKIYENWNSAVGYKDTRQPASSIRFDRSRALWEHFADVVVILKKYHDNKATTSHLIGDNFFKPSEVIFGQLFGTEKIPVTHGVMFVA